MDHVPPSEGEQAPGRPILGLVAASHAAPAVLVTAAATVLSVLAGADADTSARVAVAFLAGQLSVGWSNDWIDAERDLGVGRRDKPVVNGTVPVGLVRRAALVAAVATVPLSLALGVLAGLAHLVAVASAWAYNARLKATALSWLPYAVSFGLLPAVVVLALPGHPWPPVWLVGMGALLGTGAHLINVLPDLEDDRATGVRGVAHRLGRSATSVLAPVLLVLASVVGVTGPPGEVPAYAWVVLAVAVLLAGAAVVSALVGERLLPLVAAAAIAVVDLALLLRAGTDLVH
jgi:4-hydroxybenzoate polyprenyltransferase